jgi:hypothetical protein
MRPRRPLESLRQEIDRSFGDFGSRVGFNIPQSFFDIDPFRRAKAAFSGMPAVDVTESEKSYEVEGAKEDKSGWSASLLFGAAVVGSVAARATAYCFDAAGRRADDQCRG